jgi:signal transduction histidine kinase
LTAPKSGADTAFVPRVASETLFTGLALVGHSFSALLFLLQRGSLDLPPEWDVQFYALLAISFVFTALAAAWRDAPKAKAMVVGALFCYLLACYPIPASSGIQAVLGMPLMAAIVVTFPRPDYFFVGAASLAGILALQRPAVVWGRTRSGVMPAALVFLVFVLAFAFALAVALKELAEGRRKAMLEAERLDSAIDRIAEVNASFQSALAAAEESSKRKERNRITREIHDIVGYALTNQQMMLEASLMLVDPDGGRLRELLSMARDGVAEGLRETRKTLYELRRIEEQRDLDSGVILKAARNFEAVTGIRVAVDFTNAQGELDHAVWLAIYRLIQESMINSFRHGRAKNISITFREDARSIHVLVRDDGVGAPVLIEGIGIKGMRERMAKLGGELEVGNAADGFAVAACLPLRTEVTEEE